MKKLFCDCCGKEIKTGVSFTVTERFNNPYASEENKLETSIDFCDECERLFAEFIEKRKKEGK